MRAQHSFKKQTNPAGQEHPKQQGSGYCFKFHQRVVCAAGCAFKHLCYKYEGPHPVSRYNFCGQSRLSSTRPLPAKSQPQKKKTYLHLNTMPGPLFHLPDGSPASQAIFTDKLSMVVKYCGLDPSRYKGHSFRIGAPLLCGGCWNV